MRKKFIFYFSSHPPYIYLASKSAAILIQKNTIMKKSFPFRLLLILLLVVFTNASGQIRFQKTYGGTNSEISDCLNKSTATIITTSDGGYAICQTTISYGTSNGPYQQIYFLRLDQYGDTVVTKTYGIPGNHSIGRSIFELPEGGFILGVQWGGLQGAMGLIRINNMGDTLWTKRFKGSSQAISMGYFGFPFSDGGFGVCGAYDYSNHSCAAIAKTDANGQLIYSRLFRVTNYNSLFLYGACETHDGGIIATGIFMNAAQDALLLKTDASGNLQWIKRYGGPFNDYGYHVKELPDHSIMVAGEYGKSANGTDVDAFVMKTDSAGNLLFSKVYGDSLFQWANSFTVNPLNGEITLCGYDQYLAGPATDAYLMQLDASGNFKWGQRYGGCADDSGTSVAETADGGFALCGFTKSFGSGLYDIYLVKTDSVGDSGCNTIPIVMPANNVPFNQGNLIAVFADTLTAHPVACDMASGATVTPLCTNVGIAEQEVLPIQLYPVPADESISVSLAIAGKMTVQIYSALGQEVFNNGYVAAADAPLVLPIKNLPAGIYFLRVNTANGFAEKRFVVQR